MVVDRDTSIGFAQRTAKNLAFIKESCVDNGDDVHFVTQIINSALGLLVFPHEKGDVNDPYKNMTWKEIKYDYCEASKDFRVIKDTYDYGCMNREKCSLATLIWHLRNAICHRRVTFSSDDKLPHKVNVTFNDKCKKNKKDYEWACEISADKLELFFSRIVTAFQERA